jgi:hypothetical protein
MIGYRAGIRERLRIRDLPPLCDEGHAAGASNDGQMIFKAVLRLRGRPLTCNFSRDGGIRTRGLLLPKSVRAIGVAAVSLDSLIRYVR